MAAAVIRGGGFAVWGLPGDATCAAVARERVRGTARELGLAGGLARDAVTMVSELATNAFVHALGKDVAAPELYAYRRGAAPELVVKVFDGGGWRGEFPRAPFRPPPDAEGGRGLEMVNALVVEHGGQWGVHRSRSWRGVMAAPGKVAYFAVPVPGVWSSGPEPDCQAVGRELEGLLRARGFARLHRCEGWNMAVLSVRPEITVWVRRHGILLTQPGTGTVRYPLGEVAEVTEAIVRCDGELGAG
ncbi:ATP-binding protein [Actinomadura parmotrematis]|uniref:Histidine kinase/HSP90-like ATPase domain-containing protein n=1 Tax=Actinomadura parmotrematis TaxID=2864039 RepID=A0ABS7FWT6_9ACTN|nr:ATP-binding protein [Actinomadura parmotrematis]MBW8484889.1 hypothetical protein [Actinomadura parmotrematis]